MAVQYNNNEDTGTVNKAKIYGLLNGIEPVVDSIINEIDITTQEDIKIVTEILEPIFRDKKTYQDDGGFYGFENKLKNQGIARDKLYTILSYMKANNQYTNFINNIMYTETTPLEFKEIEINI